MAAQPPSPILPAGCQAGERMREWRRVVYGKTQAEGIQLPLRQASLQG